MVRHTFIRALAVLLTAIAAATLVTLLMGTKPAEAAFPGENGKIAFASSRTTGAGVDNPQGDSEIFAMNPSGTGIEQLNFNDANDYDLAFNHDGSKIVFTSQRDNQNEEIYVMDAAPESATNPAVRLTNNAASDVNPAFNHDGSKIVFTSNRAIGNTDIWVMDAKDEINNVTGDPGPDGNGDHLTRLTTNTAFDSFAAWSPDGSKIAFTSGRDDNNFGEIYVIDAAPESATNPAVRLTNNAASDLGPNWSPDGSKIAFTSNRAGNNNIYVMNALDGSEPKRLTKKAASDAFPAWSPDGKKIVFRSDRGGGDPEVYVMKPRPESMKNRPKNLTKNDAFDSEPDWQTIPPP